MSYLAGLFALGHRQEKSTVAPSHLQHKKYREYIKNYLQI
jgi:hypothetical protein